MLNPLAFKKKSRRGLFRRRTAPAAPAWTPLSMFASSEDGGYWNASDTSSVFQEMTGASATTPSNVGDPVGTILDLSGNGNHLKGLSSSSRPILREESSGLRYLDFDGVDDQMNVQTTMPTSTDGCMCAAFDTGSYGSNVNDSYFAIGTQTKPSRNFVPDMIYRNNSSFDNTVNVHYQDYARSDNIRINGDQNTNPVTRLDYRNLVLNRRCIILHTEIWLGAVQSMRVSGNGLTSARQMDGKWFGAFILGRLMTAQEVTDNDSYWAELVGVTLVT